MKYLRIAFGLALVAGLMAVVASPAMAAGPKWVTCEKSTTGKFNNSKCTEAGSGWETKEVAETREVTSSGTLELEDSETLAGASSVECPGTDVGTIGAGGSDSTVNITVGTCKKVKEGGCKTLEKVEPRNLPWATQLVEEGGEVRDTITSLVAGKSPGWAVTCNTLLGKKTDVCEGVTSTAVNANRTEGSVEAIFEAKSKAAKCSEGGAASGHVRGKDINRLRNSKGELQAFWVLAEALGT
jgi:hypothetical protein